MTIVRSFIFDLTFYLWTILISVVALPALLVSQRATIWISALWANVSLLLLQLIVGLTYEVRGWNNLPRGPAIVALKHQSACHRALGLARKPSDRAEAEPRD